MRGPEARAPLERIVQNMQEVELESLLFVGLEGKGIGAPIECLLP